MSAMFNNYLPYRMCTQTEGTGSEINQAQNLCQLLQKIGNKTIRKHCNLKCDTTLRELCEYFIYSRNRTKTTLVQNLVIC